MCVLVTETLHTLCALKTEVFIPTLDRSDLIHLATVTVDTGLQSLTNKINSLDTKEPVLDLTFSVWKYTHANVSLVHKEGSSGKNINLNSSDLLGFEVFKGAAITKLNM